MDRRAFIAGTLGLLGAPLAADSQPTRTLHRIGFLTAGTPPVFGPPHPRTSLEEFRRGLRERGYVEGQSFVIEGRFADTNVDWLPALAAQLVALGVDVIFANGRAPAKAAMAATATIPIVFKLRGDPVELGLVPSLARPGGNLTGLTETPGPEIAGKRLELLKEAVPRISRVAVLDASRSFVDVLQSVAPKLRIAVQHHDAKTLADLRAVLATITRQGADSLLVFGSAVTDKHLDLILKFAARNRLPTMYDDPDYVQQGILMSYSTSGADVGRSIATFVDKILKGAKPGDLPVEQPTKFDLAVNLRTARMLGLTIPPSIVARADQIIR